MLFLRLLFLMILLFMHLPEKVMGQTPSYSLGLNPPSLRWSQIDTDKVQVVFPNNLEEKGQRVARLIHYLHDSTTASIGSKKQKITIFLQNQTAIPNGFVALSPFRSEFYMNAPQDAFLGTGDWVDLLAIHEYRHVLQNTNSKRGISKAVSWLFGQNGWAFMRAMAMPRWFAEGDAVVTETALSNSGRGRLPAFHKDYRSLRLEGKHYNYEKASAFSLRDFVPTHYHLGYYLTAYVRRKYGEEIWSEVVEDAAKYRGIFFPLSKNLKRRTGLSTPKLYEETMLEMDSIWEAQEGSLELTPSTKVATPPKKTFTSYQYPRFVDDSTLLVEKRSFQQIPRIISLNRQGEEKLITLPGFNVSQNNYLTVVNDLVVWAEISFDPRWIGKDFSIIKTHNLQTRETKKLTSRSRYFVPDLNNDATEMVVVESTPELKYNLTILDPNNGDVIRKVANPENYFFSYPRWMANQKSVVVLAQKNSLQALVIVNTQSGEMTQLTDFDDNQKLHPIATKGYVVFSSMYSGINNLYAIRLSDKQLYQITSTTLGAFYPAVSPNQKELVYAEFSSMGEELRRIPFEPESWKKLDGLPKNIIDYYEPLVEQEGGSILDKVSDQENFPVKHYNKLSGLLNPHSLQPFLFHPNYSLEIQAQNKFTTLSAEAGVNYNANERNSRFFADIAYGELFPVFFAGLSTSSNRDRPSAFVNQQIVEADTSLFLSFYEREWEENEYHVGVQLPFNLMQGTHFSDLELSASYHFINVDYEDTGFRFNAEEQARDGNLNSINLGIRYTRFQQQALQHLNPRFGQYINLDYKTTLNSTLNEGSVFHIRGGLFFPGFFPNHSIHLAGGYRQEDTKGSYLFQDNFFYSRGYGSSFFNDEARRYSFNYGLPLFYPDAALGPLAFLKRVKVNLFYDHTSVELSDLDVSTLPNNTDFERVEGSIEGESSNYRSIGAELTFDFRAFRLLEVDLGVRYSYLFDPIGTNDNHAIDFVLLQITP